MTEDQIIELLDDSFDQDGGSNGVAGNATGGPVIVSNVHFFINEANPREDAGV